MKAQNDFGNMRTEYDAARKGYPAEVYDYLRSLLGVSSPYVVDIGCGTGISTRELAVSGFSVIGVDKDKEMIELAQERDHDIQYITAAADDLPFPDETFDAVSAFTAFHWFNDEQSLSEIKRVVKTGGVVFFALKGNSEDRETEAFRKGYMNILKKYAGENFDTTKEHFRTNIVDKLFRKITKKSFVFDEKYSLEEALVLIRSLSLWNLVLDQNKGKMIQELGEFYKNNLVDGFVIRKREIFTLTGTKK